MLAAGSNNQFHIPGTIREKTSYALAGDTSLLGEVFEYFRPRLLAHAMRICGNSPLARDAVQDTFISVFTKLGTLKNVDLFYPWMKKILVNNCYLLLRRERSVELNESHSYGETLLQHSIESRLDEAADKQKLFESLSILSEELRSCMMLRYFSQSRSYDSIAQLLGLPVGTVRSRLAAGREKLATLFQAKPDSSDRVVKESLGMSQYYLHMYNKLYDDPAARKELLEHHSPQINIRYTSGSSGTGRGLLEKEVYNDLKFGSRFCPDQVISCGNVSVVEGMNMNHPDYPDRCAPHTAMVLFRSDKHINTLHIFDSTRV